MLLSGSPKIRRWTTEEKRSEFDNGKKIALLSDTTEAINAHERAMKYFSLFSADAISLSLSLPSFSLLFSSYKKEISQVPPAHQLCLIARY